METILIPIRCTMYDTNDNSKTNIQFIPITN